MGRCLDAGSVPWSIPIHNSVVGQCMTRMAMKPLGTDK